MQEQVVADTRRRAEGGGAIARSPLAGTGTFLSFHVDREVYAVDALRVREVLDFTPVTRVPRTPEFMTGVINLRGSVVPVVDLRLKFGLEAAARTVDTCIVVLEVRVDGETAVLGALADSVREVLDLEPEQVEPPPRIGTRLPPEFILGMGKQEETFLIILDIDRVFSVDEIALVEAAGDRQSSEGQSSEGQSSDRQPSEGQPSEGTGAEAPAET